MQRIKDCGEPSNTKSEAALFVIRDNAKKLSGICFRCNKRRHMMSCFTVEQCSICMKCGYNESKFFQESRLDKILTIGGLFDRAVSFLSIVVLIVRKVKN